jgi:hypothetical protein
MVKKTSVTAGTKKPTHKQAVILLTKQEHPDLTTREIAAIADTEHSYVIKTLQRYGIEREPLERYKRSRADIFAGLQERILSSVTTEDIQKASLFQKAGVVGLLYDKERLESGLSTGNLAVIHADIAALRNVDIPVDNSTCQPNNDHVDV